jgi:DNA-binding transcriptional MerR regulator
MRQLTTAELTLGRLARTCGLARTSLLHYESLGLLVPARRSAAGYRLYGEAELERLRSIRRYREAGLSLVAIKELLLSASSTSSSNGKGSAALLEARLLDICGEMERLRQQQRQLARLLAAPEFRAGRRCRGKAAWVALLRRAGFDDDDMMKWHGGFEADSPEDHAAFLRSLGLAPTEVASIRRRSKGKR